MSSPFWWEPFTGSIAAWWLASVALGWLCFPLVYRCLVLLPDHGFAVSKLAGLALLTFSHAWIALAMGKWGANEGGLATRATVAAVVLLLAVNLIVLRQVGRSLLRFVRENWKRVVGYEIGFLGAFLAYLWFRSYVPDATFDVQWYGAEKWANLSILTGLWRNPVVPPTDPWLSGLPLNYYYFSHLGWALMARLTGVEPQVAFNLGLGSLFALLVTMSYGAGHAVAERRAGGWWAVFLVSFAGTPATWAQSGTLWRAAGRFGPATMLRAFDFWGPSDVIPHTRNEFPAFNWLLGDLHAHGTGLLLLLLALCVIVQMQRAREVDAAGWGRLARSQLAPGALLAVVVGCLWATNAWDVAVLGLLGLFWVVGESLHDRGGRDRAAQTAAGLVLWGLVAGVALLVLARFHSGNTRMPLESTNATLATLPGPLALLGSLGAVGAGQRTTLREWVLFWGFAGVAAILAAWLLLGVRRSLARLIWLGLAAILACDALAMAIYLDVGGPVAGLGAIVLAVCLLWAYARLDASAAIRWALLLGAGSLACQAIPEFVFLNDPIGPPNDRYNTVFKFYYSGWALAGLALAAALSGIPVALRESRGRAIRGIGWAGFALAVGLLVVGGGAYPVLGTLGRVARGQERLRRVVEEGMPAAEARPACRTLDGLGFMSLPEYAPDDLTLGLWMRDNLPEGTRIVESSRKSYAMDGRFAAITGFPAFLGWPSHEVQWRGARAFDPVFEERSMALRLIYEGKDPELALAVCRAFDLRWVVVGSLERERYQTESLRKLGEIGRVAQQTGGAILYEIDLDGLRSGVTPVRPD